MAYLIGLDDIVNHNGHRVTLLQRAAGTYSSDRFIPGDFTSTIIRGYIFPTGRQTRTMYAAGEITMHDINMWVSNRRLARNSVTISMDDVILYKDTYYEIISSQPVDVQGSMTEYTLRIWVTTLETPL